MLFGGEDELKKNIDLDVFLHNIKIKRLILINLHEGLKDCYSLRMNGSNVKTLDALKCQYRKIYFDYPKDIESKSYDEEMAMTDKDRDVYIKSQADKIDAILKPIKSEIEFLQYKIKENTPIDNDDNKGETIPTGLSLHIEFVQQVNSDRGYIDRRMTVNEFKHAYDSAIDKNNKLKVK